MTDEELKKFKKKIKKTDSGRTVSGSLCIKTRDLVIRMKRKNPAFKVLHNRECYAIINDINSELVESLFKKGYMRLPYGLGIIKLKKKNMKPYYSIWKKRVINHRLINWNSTLELWAKDEECHKKGVVIRYDCDTNVFLDYKNFSKKFNEVDSYYFKPLRKIKNRIMKSNQEDLITYE